LLALLPGHMQLGRRCTWRECGREPSDRREGMQSQEPSLILHAGGGGGAARSGTHVRIPRSKAGYILLSNCTDVAVHVVVFGTGAFGQLGSGRGMNHLEPCVLHGLGQLCVQVSRRSVLAERRFGVETGLVRHRSNHGDSLHVVCSQMCACGESHSALLTQQGHVYTFGLGQFGVLGHGSEDKCSIPRRVERLAGQHVKSVACGWRHTAALTAQCMMYTWGHGAFGQLGQGGTIAFFFAVAH